MKHTRPHILVAITLAITVLCGLHDSLRNALTDLRFDWTPRQASGDIVVIGIDSTSIDAIGVWPWPRRLHADLLRRLDAAQTADVVFDVDFSSPSDPASDQAFVEALKAAGGSTVLPSFRQQRADSRTTADIHINRPLKPFLAQSWAAIVNVSVEPDGLVRHYPFGESIGGEFFPSMGAVLAGQYADKSKPFLIDFGIRAASIPTVSYVDVLRGDPATLQSLKGKKVIIGGSALELGDRFSVPNGAVIPGPVLQALAAESILQGRVLRPTSDLATAIGLALIAALMALSWRRRTAGAKVGMLIAVGAAIEAGALLVQSKWPVVLDTSLLQTAIVVYLAAIALDEIDFRGLLGRIAERRFQRIAMSLGDGLVCADPHGTITVWNPGAAAMFGYRSEEMIGQPFETVLCAVNDPASGAAFSLTDMPQELLRLPGGKVMELAGQRKTGEIFPLEACLSGWQGTDGFQYGAILRDISERKREAERIRYLAEYDTLTQLPNRHSLRQHLTGAIAIAEAGKREIALLLLGVDKLQQINDLLGHACGDQVLAAAAARLKTEIGDQGFVARLGGDEFAVVLAGTDLAATLGARCERIAQAFDAPLAAGTRQHRINFTIGAAIYPQHGTAADELMSNSHLALGRAKASRRGQIVVFEQVIRDEIEKRLTLEAELALALDRHEFELFYQPQVRLSDFGLIGAEALIRWRHPTRGLVSPAEFIPVINASPLSNRLAAWVLRTACVQARRWELDGHMLRIGINLSPSQIQSGDLAALVRETLTDTGLSPSLLELEVTEDILLNDAERLLDTFSRIQALGTRIVFDDFGTGYASLSYLKTFPLDGLKIDRSFVMELLAGSHDAAIVSTTISLGRQLGLSVIAEGIESRATADLLAAMGCEEGQGYHFGKPMPAAAFEQTFFAASARAVGTGHAA